MSYSENAQKKFISSTERESALTKGMWAGAVKRMPLELMGVSEQGVVRTIPNEHTPALLKAFDEIITNACDHAVSHPNDVSYIDIDLNETNGQFVVTNDGPGIPVVKHDAVSAKDGRDVYVPEVAMFRFLSGSNMKKGADSVTGGMNGIGGTLGSVHANESKITTVDAVLGLKYEQTSRDRMAHIDAPVITKAVGTKPFTRVNICPAFASLGYAATPTPDELRDIADWMRLRALLLASYVPGTKVTFNGREMPNKFTDIAPRFLSSQLNRSEWKDHAVQVQCELKSPLHKHSLRISVIVSPDIKKFEHVTVINGVVSSAGSHLKFLRAKFKEIALDMISDKDMRTSTTEICKHVFVTVIGAIPGIDWSGQRKDEISIPSETLKSYKFPESFRKELGAALRSLVLEQRSGKKKRVKPENFAAATQARQGSQCKLLIAEGDSALTFLKVGMGLKKVEGAPSSKSYGRFSLQGVIMNVAKEVTEQNRLDGRKFLARSQNLMDNRVISEFESIIGLRHDATYETAAERAELHYCAVIACVDQDVDGAGKILGLFLNYIHLFWPALIRHGFVQWFMTPIVRVYPASAKDARGRARAALAGKVETFYHEAEYEQWAEVTPEVEQAKCEVRYYKGLGAHDMLEVPDMFRNFEQKLYTFEIGDVPAVHTMFDVYFGKSSEPRKEVLRRPMAKFDADTAKQLSDSRRIDCSQQLELFTKAYKLDALERQLPGIDGLTVGRRKSLAGARKKFNGGGVRECKTFQLGGYVADNMSYHHGDASINGTITMMCQTFPGARSLPLLSGSGMFGTRLCGGSDAASPRYTNVSLNRDLVNALFPVADDNILPYSFVDGVRAEPKTYVPLIPLAVLESNSNPSEGWKFQAWGRDFAQVLELTRAFVDATHPHHRLVRVCATAERTGDDMIELQKALPLDVSMFRHHGKVMTRNGKPCHRGDIMVDHAKCLVTITELPMRVWNSTYLKALVGPTIVKNEDGTVKEIPNKKLVRIKNVRDNSSGDEVSIAVKFKAGQMPGTLDEIYDFLNLHQELGSHLNIMRPVTGGVLEFGDSYHALALYTLPLRQRLYVQRCERHLKLLELRIRVQRETVRYIKTQALDSTKNVASYADEEAAVSMLKSNGFPAVRIGKLQAPGYMPTNELAALVAPADASHGVELYGYLLNLRERDLVARAVSAREEKIVQLDAERQRVSDILAERPVPAASVWLSELAALERIVKSQELA